MKFSMLLVLSIRLLICLYIERINSNALVDGEKAQVDELKYVVAITLNGKTLCTGGIISEDLILSAAHCFIDSKKQQVMRGHWKVIAGAKNLNDVNRVDVKVEKVYLPHDISTYSDSKFKVKGDIAIIKLEEKLDFNNNTPMEALDLPEEQHDYKYDDILYMKVIFTIGGFGVNKVELIGNNATGEPADELFKADVNYIRKSSCVYDYGPSKVKIWHICGKVVKRKGGVCEGDSGAPLVVKNSRTLIGVLSATNVLCDESLGPAIYTKVGYYMYFIRQILNNNFAGVVAEDLYYDGIWFSVKCWLPSGVLTQQQCTIQ